MLAIIWGNEMGFISLTYIVFFCLGIAIFTVLRPALAVAIVYLSGMIFLPVTDYFFPLHSDALIHTIMPMALPSDHLINKGWVATVTAAIGAVTFDWRTIVRFRFSPLDLPIICWCLWPMAQAVFFITDPAADISSLYLWATWGLPWFLGRIYFGHYSRQLVLIDTVIYLSLPLLAIALVEGFTEIRVYEWAYGQHPFADVGAGRYVGNRPLAMFEDGNQYGLWMACIAVLAAWRAWSHDSSKTRIWIAALFILASFASQSIGAILLMILGIGAIFLLSGVHLSRRFFVLFALVLGIGFGLYVNGVLPLRYLATDTPAGEAVLNALKASDRDSFSWRISQDEKAMPTLRTHLLTGSGKWDWWRESGTRPWGFSLLLIGQFGLIGLSLLGTALLGSLLARRQKVRATIHHISDATRNPAIAIIAVIFMAALDALLNAFIFLPAILFLAAIANHQTKDSNTSG